MKRASEYPAASIDDTTKSVIARLYVIQNRKGKPRKEFTLKFAEAGLEFSERQLDRWVLLVNSGVEAISTEKLAGGPALLTRPQRDISSEWVIDQIEHGIAVHLATFCEFLQSHFSIIISNMTASNYLSEDGFTYRIIKKKTSSFVIDVERLKIDLWNRVSSKKKLLKCIPLS